MRTSNPALNDSTFINIPSSTSGMTIRGTVNKCFLLIFLVFPTAIWSWNQAFPGGWGDSPAPVLPWWYIPVIFLSLGLGLLIGFKKHLAPFIAPLYALSSGLTLGAFSAFFEARFPGIVFQATLCTMGTFVALLLAYTSRLIRPSENFKLGVIAATGGIAFVYLINLVLHFFGMRVPFIHESGPLGIGISIFITIIAALNLVLDFDFIEKATELKLPKYMEWYAAFGLIVTLIWLYIEFIKLIAKSRKK